MEILLAPLSLTMILPSWSMQTPAGYEICPVPMVLMWLPFWWNTWIWLLSLSATNMLSSESTKRCQGFETCPAPTMRTKLPWKSKICNRLPMYSLPTIFPFGRRPTPTGWLIWPFPVPFDPNFLTNWPWVEDLNAMVVSVSHNIISLLINNNTTWGNELAIAISLWTKHTKKGALLIKNLNAVVGGVSYHDLVVSLINSHTARLNKLPISLSIRPKLKQESAILIKHLNAMVVSISDNNFSPGIACDRKKDR